MVGQMDAEQLFYQMDVRRQDYIGRISRNKAKIASNGRTPHFSSDPTRQMEVPNNIDIRAKPKMDGHMVRAQLFIRMEYPLVEHMYMGDELVWVSIDFRAEVISSEISTMCGPVLEKNIIQMDPKSKDGLKQERSRVGGEKTGFHKNRNADILKMENLLKILPFRRGCKKNFCFCCCSK